MRFKIRYGALSCAVAALVLTSIVGCTSPNGHLAPSPDASATENGNPASAPAAVAKAEPGQRVYYILLDTSGSMSGSGIADAKAALTNYLQKAPQDIIFGLAVFEGNGAIELVPISKNGRAEILQKLPQIGTGGGTPLSESLVYCTEKIVEQQKKQLGYGSFNLLVVTDGQANNLPEGIAYVRSHGAFGAPISISTIGYNLGQTHELAQASVWYGEASDRATLEKKLLEATSAEARGLDDLLDF